jgi:RHS repeat-associated protein
VSYDGNGNVTALVSGADSSVTARYEYDPFGRTIRATGLVAAKNPMRFSTKRFDEAADLAYYGYRYYSPSTGRWLSRDPAGSAAAKNLYGYSRNTLATDFLGLFDLHYINHPQWVPASETLWVGHYVTFEKADLAKLTPGQPVAGQSMYDGTLLLHYQASASITHCATGSQLADASRDLYFVNQFTLNEDAVLARADKYDLFDDGRMYMGNQMANVNMKSLFFESPDFGDLPSEVQRSLRRSFGKTKGSFHATMELKVYPGRIHPKALESMPSGHELGSKGFTMIDGHEIRRYYLGFTETTPPDFPGQPVFSTIIDLTFNWDNCCWTEWDFTISPPAAPGRNRLDNPADPGAINLHLSPRFPIIR